MLRRKRKLENNDQPEKKRFKPNSNNNIDNDNKNRKISEDNESTILTSCANIIHSGSNYSYINNSIMKYDKKRTFTIKIPKENAPDHIRYRRANSINNIIAVFWNIAFLIKDDTPLYIPYNSPIRPNDCHQLYDFYEMVTKKWPEIKSFPPEERIKRILMSLNTDTSYDGDNQYKRLLFSIIMLLLVQQIKKYVTDAKSHQETVKIFEKISLPKRLEENNIPLLIHNHTQTLINIRNDKKSRSLLNDIPQDILPKIANYLCDFKILLHKNTVSLFYNATKANKRKNILQDDEDFAKMVKTWSR